MSFKRIFSRLVSFSLIGAGLYQILYSSSLIFFVYPKLKISQDTGGLLIQEGLIEKAIIYWLMMAVNGFYGFFLLFKPEEEIRLYHLVAGVAVSVFSIFFIVRTPLTTGPILFLLQKYFKP